jgi:hypothetical protein
MTLLIITLFIVAALLSIPIAHALVLASVGGLLIIDTVPVHLAIEQMLAQTQSFPLIAIPFFMMTGALMVSGKLGQSLVKLLSMMIGASMAARRRWACCRPPSSAVSRARRWPMRRPSARC